MPKKKENLSPEERLIKAVIPKEEEPYKLPNNWVWTRLGDIVDIKGGKRIPKGEEFSKTKTENIYLRVTDFKNRGIDLENLKYISDEIAEKIKNYRITSKDIYLSIAGTIGKVGIIPKEIESSFLTENACKLTNFNSIDQKFLLNLLESSLMKKEIKSSITSSGQPKLAIFRIENFPIPLPSLDEQKRIVEKLDSLFEKTGKIKEIIEEVKEKTSSRREAVLSKAFTGELTEKWRAENKTENAKELLLKINEENLKNNPKAKIKDISEMLVNEDEVPYKIPENWVWTKVGNVTNYGEIKQTKAEDISENDWILELEDIEKGTFKLLNRVLKKERQNKSNKHIFFKGDILYSKLRPYLNKILIAKEDGYATTEIIPFKGLCDLDNKYIFYYFTFSKTVEMINFLTHGMQMPRLGTDKAKNLLFPLPPIEEQKEIVRILDKVFEEENKISELISLEEKVEILEKTILDKTFRGELGTGNADDEPALELLKKVVGN